jgi:hypothetical protein
MVNMKKLPQIKAVLLFGVSKLTSAPASINSFNVSVKLY